MRKMTNTLRNECMEVIRDHAGVSLTIEQFEEIMHDNPSLRNQLIRFNSPSDTMDREDLMSAVAVKLTGRQWPTYGDGQEAYDKFINDFKFGAMALGYALCS